MSLEIEQLESKLSRRPHSPLFSRLACEYLSANRVEEARELCKTGIDKYPSYSTAHLLLAKCYEAENNHASALESIQIAESLNPKSQIIIDFHSKIESFLSPPIIGAIETPPLEQTEIPLSAEPELNSEIVDHTMSLVESAPSISEHEQQFESCTSLPVEDEITTVNEENNKFQDMEIQREIVTSIEQPADNKKEETETAGEPIVIQEELLETEAITSIPEINEKFEAPIQETMLIKEQANDEHEQIESPEVTNEIEQAPFTTSILADEQILETNQAQPEKTPVETQIESPIEDRHYSSIQSAIPGEQSEINLIKERDRIVKETPTESPEEGLELNDSGRIVSKTLAEIYAAQGEFDEAIITYQLLKQKHPNQSEVIDKRISELEDKTRLKSD